MATTITIYRKTKVLWSSFLLAVLVGLSATPCLAQQVAADIGEEVVEQGLVNCVLEPGEDGCVELPMFVEPIAALRLPLRREVTGPPMLPPQHLKAEVEAPPLPALDALPITLIDMDTNMVYVQSPTLMSDSLPAPVPVVASYYHSALAGNLTANGERYDPKELTAAHRSLPFGTRLRITNVRNDKSVIVRINDRGPFIKGRVVDLSHAAAELLGMLRRGVARVTIEKLDT